jgi:exosortase
MSTSTSKAGGPALPTSGAPTLPLGGSADDRRSALVGLAVVLALLLTLYAPVLYYMVLHWSQVEDYSHGFLIVPLAVYFAWERRAKVRKLPIEPSWWGVVPLALGSFTLAVGRLGTELMNLRASFVFALIGLVLLLLGRRIFRVLAFPLLFLFLMVPLPQSLVNVIAFPLQLIAADMAVSFLHFVDIPVLREGNILHLAYTQLFVAEACSGLRSLMALITLGVVFAYFFRKSAVERIVIVLSAIPIAILVNAFRVALTGVLAHYYGDQATKGVVHATEGLFTFGIAFLLLLAEARLLNWLWPRIARRRKVPA